MTYATDENYKVVFVRLRNSRHIPKGVTYFPDVPPEPYYPLTQKGTPMYYEENIVLCASSAYEEKYYLNEDFEALPQQIKDELKIMCVLYTADVGGILRLEYEPDGTLVFQVEVDEGDLLFDEIGSALKIKKLQQEKRELLIALELFYKVFFLGEELEDEDGRE